jgi:hypothetical protein
MMSRGRTKYNIKINFEEFGCEDVNWFDLNGMLKAQHVPCSQLMGRACRKTVYYWSQGC